MHYYQHHIGDFVRDTSRLSDAQSMAYLRLLWAYYDKEQPLANSVGKLAFQIGASEKDVGLILEHFFKLDTEENVWRHKRCDAEIEAYKAKEEKARKSANARWGNKSSASKAQKTSSKDAQTVQPQCERNANASKSDANQEPITNNQEPITNRGEVLETSRVHAHEAPPARVPKTFPELVDDFVQPPPKATATATMYGATCIALKAAGIADVAPGNLEFRALVDAGIGIDVFTEVAAKAVATGKGRFKYVIAAVNGKIKDAQATAAAAKSATPLRAIAGGKAAYQNPLKVADAAAETEKARRMLFGGTPPDDPNTVDVETRFVDEKMIGVRHA